MGIAGRFRGIVAVALCLASVGKAVPVAEQMDQSNLPEWAGGWTHVNPAGEGQAAMWQTFTPGGPSLTAVEIDVLAINPGWGDDVLTVEIARDGAVLASAERLVADGFSGLLRFAFAEAVSLVPEQIHELRVRDTGRTQFGWKYGPNTYERGTRFVFAQPRPGTDWLFRTYSKVEPAAAKYSGGTGEPNDPYQIATAADLIVLGDDPNDYDKHFILTADIDLDPNLPGGKVFDKAVIAPGVFSYSRISPYEIGRSGTPFVGVLDGNGHTIRHLTARIEQVKMEETLLAGLFGILRGEVRNLVVADVNIAGFGCPAGGLAADNEGAITDCRGSGTVGGTDHVGGLVGVNYGSMTQCHSTSTVKGDSRLGGLVGINGAWDMPDASVTQCSSTGAVRGGAELGGLVGENGGVIARCCSSGVVSGTYNLGGLVGQNWIGVEIAQGGRVEKSYSSALVEGTNSIGGLIGSGAGSVIQCYSTGAVRGTGFAGGFVGCPLIYEWMTPDSGFWDTQTSGQSWSAGGTGKTTAEMQTARTFLDAGWDFVAETANGAEDIWRIDEGRDYPRLWWELPDPGTEPPAKN